jgi:hypothetical protein
MDIDTLSKGVGLFGSAIVALKQAIELIPNGSKRIDAIEALERAEQEFKLAEAKSAQKLGYEICRKHFPPIIMLEENENIWVCPQCNNKKDTSPFGAVI